MNMFFEKGESVVSTKNGRIVTGFVKVFSRIVIVMKVWEKGVMKRKERWITYSVE